MNFSNSGTLLLGGATSVSVAPNQCATFAYDDYFQKWTLTGADPTTALSAASGTQVANHTVAYNGTSNQVLAESNAYAGINGAHWGDSGFNLDTDPLSATFPQETISSYTFQGTLPAFGVGDDVICHIDPTGNQVGAPGQIVTENCIDAAQSGATAGQSCWRTYGISAWGTWTCGGSGGAFSGGLGASYQDVTEIAAPSNPASGNDRLYTNSSTHLLGCLTSSGGSCMPSGGGGVSSVGLSVPSWLTVTGSPVTTSGTLAVAPTTGQTTHQVIGTCGSATTFGPCALVAGDIPTLNQNTTGSAAKWTTARNLAGNSVDGSANVTFANKFIVQGTLRFGVKRPPVPWRIKYGHREEHDDDRSLVASRRRRTCMVFGQGPALPQPICVVTALALRQAAAADFLE